MDDLSSVFVSPSVFPEKIDLPNRNLHCCNMSAESYERSPFLDHRIIKLNDETIIVSLAELLVRVPETQVATTHYVFHNAFCCSTLYSRCLNAAKQLLVLREPNVLMEVASIYRFRGTQLLPDLKIEVADDIFSVTTRMLSRRYQGQSNVIIKPSDACNNIMHRLLEEHVRNKCLLMYSELERFLVAILKQPHRVEWVKIRATELTLDEMHAGRKVPVNPQTLDAVSTAAYVWVLHMKKMRALQKTFGKDRVKSLNSEVFMSSPVKSVAAGLMFFGSEAGEAEIDVHVNRMMQNHSKASTLQYSYEQREQDFVAQRMKFNAEIVAGLRWVSEHFGELAMKNLDSPLVRV